MTIGELEATVLLDNPAQYHFGSQEPVTGRVQLFYRPHKSLLHRHEPPPELFGPLRLVVCLHGCATSGIYEEERVGLDEEFLEERRCRVPLFSMTELAYDGQFRSQPQETQEFPFRISFPDFVNEVLIDRLEPTGAFVPDAALPPTFSGWSFDRYEAFIHYRIGVEASMPGINVNIKVPHRREEPEVRYERPAFPPSQAQDTTTLLRTGQMSVSNEHLLPESERAHNFKAKFKAFTKSHTHHDYYPKYVFDWQCHGPQAIHLNQPLTFQVSIQPREEESTAVEKPYVQLTHFELKLEAETLVRAARGLFFAEERGSETTAATLQAQLQTAMPFSEAENWTQTVDVGRLQRVPSSFRTLNIVRTYIAKVKLGFTVAGKKEEFTERFPVVVLPPIDPNAVDTSSLWATAAWGSQVKGGNSFAPPLENGYGSAPPPQESGYTNAPPREGGYGIAPPREDGYGLAAQSENYNY